MPEAVAAVAEEGVNEQENTAADEAGDADFESGFEKPTEQTPAIEKPADSEIEPTAGTTPAEGKPAEVKYRQITEAEYNELKGLSTEIASIKADHARKLDTAFGKVGGLERKLGDLQSATPTGYTVDVTDEIVADLRKEFPELGDLALKAFKTFAGKLKGTAPAPAKDVDPQQLKTAATQSVIESQAELLDDEHPGWRELTGTQDQKDNAYRQWLAAQPAEYQQRINSTRNATVLAKSITKFKSDQDTAKAAADAAKKTADAEQSKKDAAAKKAVERKQQLERAATPRGAGGHTPTEATEDDFEAGFKSGPAGRQQK